ncbi:MULTISPECIES: hypothetical protein [unclassified Streptomyces]|nr:hypothetical protein [Streptomyces sp. NBC_01361]
MAHEFENLRTEIAHSYTPGSLLAPRPADDARPLNPRFVEWL